MTCNSKYSKDNHKLFDIAIDAGNGCAGAGSLECPYEPIIVRRVVTERWLPLEYFKPWEEHNTKSRLHFL